LGCKYLSACLQHCFRSPLPLRFVNSDRIGMSPGNVRLKFSSAFNSQFICKTNGNFATRKLVENLVTPLKKLLPVRSLPSRVCIVVR
jgi:hypothetical protein